MRGCIGPRDGGGCGGCIGPTQGGGKREGRIFNILSDNRNSQERVNSASQVAWASIAMDVCVYSHIMKWCMHPLCFSGLRR